MKKIMAWLRIHKTTEQQLMEAEAKLSSLPSGCMCGHFEWCDVCSPSSKLNIRRDELRNIVAELTERLRCEQPICPPCNGNCNQGRSCPARK